jgi:hypothetical protein
MRSRIRVILAGLALLASFYALTAQACMRVGLEAGLNQSKVSLATDLDLPDLEPSYRPAWSAGVTLDVPLAAKLSLASGLRYIEYGDLLVASIVSTGGGARYERRLVWRYLSIPAQLRLHPFAARGVFLGLGPDVGYLLTVWHHDDFTVSGMPRRSPNGATFVRPTGQIIEDVGTFFADPHGAYSRWNFALAGSAGGEFPLAGHTGLVEARYTHGLVDIAKSDALKRSTRGIELLLGARW